MIENATELSRPLVVGHKRDGRTCYDREAKRELVEACLQPGVSVARLALQHGVNANLLRRWIDHYREDQLSVVTNQPLPLPAFVPVVTTPTPESTALVLSVVLSNGVKLDLSGMAADALADMLNCLARLPCSVSTRD